MVKIMKILWLCNLILPKIAMAMGRSETIYGGWLTGLSDSLLKEDAIELAICFPILINKIEKGTADTITYYAFPKSIKSYYMYDRKIEDYFREIIKDYKPDIIHIFGTEYPHTLAMTNVCKSLELDKKVIITIQGLMTVCKKHYYSGLPAFVIYGFTLRDFIVQNNIYQLKRRFTRNSRFEERAIKNVEHIIGRTDLDRAITYQINPNAKYYACNETLRSSFYNKTWELKECRKYSIFISQGSYPIKGLHWAIEALSHLLTEFPDCHLYVAGKNPIKNQGRNLFTITNYGKYIRKLIKHYKLQSNITFLGELTEEEMLQQYLSTHVFVSASSIENSPNSVGEAMLLGVPTISSFVGGVSSLITHKVDGFLYQHDAPYILAYYIKEIFNHDSLAITFSNNARYHGLQTHNKRKNTKSHIDLYKHIFAKNEAERK